jgi:SAM-dependent methyltransferase
VNGSAAASRRPGIRAAPVDIDTPGARPHFWEPETEGLLERIGLAPGATCLDLGRGAPGVLGPLSRRVGRRGRVIGLVAGGEQESLALYAGRAGSPPNLDVVGAEALSELSLDSFDLVHARFLLPPVGADGELLQTMIGLTRPGGVIAVQEPDASVWRCYPADRAWDRLTGAIGAAAARGGADLTAGQRTHALFRRAGLEAVRASTVATALHDGHPAMRLPILLAEALREHIIGAGLLTEPELDAALRACERRVLESETLVTTFLVVQVWGRKAPA